MNSKIFISSLGWFSLMLPSDWEEYDDDEEGTYAFFNAKSWSGNFRVTPIRWKNIADPEEDKSAKYIAEEIFENEGATRIKLGKYECAYYKKNVVQDAKEHVMHYWTTGKRNILFICSFTIDKEQEQTERHKIELEIVQNIIRSIKIN